MRDLIKNFSITSGSTVFQLLCGMVSTKVFAHLIGPEGTGSISTWQLVIQTLSTIGICFGSVALVQGASAKQSDEKADYIANVARVCIIVSAILVVFVLFFPQWVLRVFVSEQVDSVSDTVVRSLILPSLLNVAVSFSTSLLAVQGLYARMSWGKVILGAITVICAWPSSQLYISGWYSYSAALLSAPLLFAFIYYGVVLFRLPLAKEVINRWNVWKWGEVRYFFAFVGTTVITSCALLWLQSYSRKQIISAGGLYEVGLFNTAWNFCMQYATLILGAFGTYYLPSLSAEKDPALRKEMITRMFRFATILGGSVVIGVIGTKSLAVTLLTSEEYLGCLPSLRWMLIGDFFKITSWALTMVSISRNDKKHILGIEGVFFVAMAASLLFVKQSGDSEKVAMGFAIGYILFAVYGFWYVARVEKMVLAFTVLRTWALFCGLVIAFSILCWNDASVNWLLLSVVAFVVAGTVWACLDHNEIRYLRKKLRME